MKQETQSLEDVLAYCQAHSLPLHYAENRLVDVWTPSVRGVPMRIRRAVKGNQATIAAMMRAGDTMVCPSPILHRKRYWRRGICLLCQRIDGSMQSENEKAS